MIDTIIKEALNAGAPYVVIAALLLFVFKPPKWFTKIIDAMIENSKVRAASFERILGALQTLERAILNQLQVHERTALEHLQQEQEWHSETLARLEKVVQTDRHDERNRITGTVLGSVVGEIHEARDYLCEKIDESLEKAIAKATTIDLKRS